MRKSLRIQRYKLQRIRQEPWLQFQYMAFIGAFVAAWAWPPEIFVLFFGIWTYLFFAYRNRTVWKRLVVGLFWFRPWPLDGVVERSLVSAHYFYVEPCLLASLLRANGIESSIIDEHIGSMRWHYARAVGGVKLSVRSEDRSAALEVIANAIESNRELRSRCPACGSVEIEYHQFWMEIAIASAIAFALLPLPRNSFRCVKCRHTWKASAARDPSETPRAYRSV